MSISIYQGDPKIFISVDGAFFKIDNGQPEMEQGIENQLNYSLFTDEDWGGNFYLKGKQKAGSKFEKTAKGTINLQKINDVRQACLSALENPIFGDNECEVLNPTGNRLDIVYKAVPPTGDPIELAFTKNGINWFQQFARGT